MKVNPRKAAIIGCGFVGASIAFRFLQQGLFSQLVLVDVNREKAEGEAMDLSDGLPYAEAMEITAGGYDDIADCALIVITAGANQKPGETRLDLIGKNISILKGVIGEITARDFGGILLVVSNPVDVLTYAAWKLSGYPKNRVIGSGTVLDTARLKQILGEKLGVDSRNVHAFIVGEHGDSELAVWSGANVSGMDLDQFCHLRGDPWTGRRWSASTRACGTAPMRSSVGRAPPTTASPWRWAALPSASSGMRRRCCLFRRCWRASTAWRGCA